jgi:hypothetical protein
MNPLTLIPSAYQSATSGIQRAIKAHDQDAHVVANSTDVSSRETVSALVDARQQVLYTRAAAKIITSTDAMTKTLLDIRA